MEDHHLNQRIHQILQGKIAMGAGTVYHRRRRTGGVLNRVHNPWLSFLADARAQGMDMHEASKLYRSQHGGVMAGGVRAGVMAGGVRAGGDLKVYQAYIRKQKAKGLTHKQANAKWRKKHPLAAKVKKVRKQQAPSRNADDDQIMDSLMNPQVRHVKKARKATTARKHKLSSFELLFDIPRTIKEKKDKLTKAEKALRRKELILERKMEMYHELRTPNILPDRRPSKLTQDIAAKLTKKEIVKEYNKLVERVPRGGELY